MEHRLVTPYPYYEITFGCSYRTANKTYLDRVQELLEECELFKDEEHENTYTVLRDYEGDFEGIEIYNQEDTQEWLGKICKEYGIDFNELEDYNLKLMC